MFLLNGQVLVISFQKFSIPGYQWTPMALYQVQKVTKMNLWLFRNKAPLYTKLTLMDCGIGNTNLFRSSSSGLGYDCFYVKSTDGTTMYFNLGSGIGSGRFQTDY